MRILVVGGAGGIGGEAVKLLSVSHPVMIADIDSDAGTSLASQTETAFLPCDVRDNDQIEQMVAKSTDTLGGLEGFAYCAGLQAAGPFIALDLATWHDLVRVNLTAALLIVQNLLRAGTGLRSIVLVASIAGVRSGGPGLVAYGASKAGLLGLTRGLAEELAPDVRVNALAPGWTDTSFNYPVTRHLAAGGGGLDQEIRRAVPMKRQADPREQGAALAWLLADAPKYLTGHTLIVDGGVTLM